MPDDVIDVYAEKLPALIAALEIGECVSECKRFSVDELTSEMLLDSKLKSRNRGTAAVGRAKSRAPRKAKFEMLVTDFRAGSHFIVVCLLITRIN
jgi:hypothetical protein